MHRGYSSSFCAGVAGVCAKDEGRGGRALGGWYEEMRQGARAGLGHSKARRPSPEGTGFPVKDAKDSEQA